MKKHFPIYTDCRAYPDEKGIETDIIIIWVQPRIPRIAEPIPMKRELKPYHGPHYRGKKCRIAEPIPMKRELKRDNRA